MRPFAYERAADAAGAVAAVAGSRGRCTSAAARTSSTS